jgi:hypothetical protein
MAACGEDVDEGAAAQHEGMRQAKAEDAERESLAATIAAKQPVPAYSGTA